MQLKEILVLHHSHFDLGYTHSQPILWKMQPCWRRWRSIREQATESTSVSVARDTLVVSLEQAFDAAGEQAALSGACRNWFTVDTFAAMHSPDRGAALFCPDAPLVMAGGFNLGPPLAEVPRSANPLLVAWPLNNYWNTNFPLTQPGKIRLRYGLLTHGAFDAVDFARMATVFSQPILVHPAFGAA